MTENVGALVRHWRQRRRLSQQAVSDRCGVSTRHLSCVETGRARPSRRLLTLLGDTLDVPLRDQRRLWTAAGYAPRVTEQPLDAPAMRHLHGAIRAILDGHEPFPALVIDNVWNLVDANDSAYRWFTGTVDPQALEPPVNVLRLALAPGGLAGRIVNLDEVRGHLLTRLRHELDLSDDPRLAALLAEVEAFPPRPGGPATDETRDPVGPDPADGSPLAGLVMTVRLRTGDGPVLTFFTTTTVFGTPRDVTVAELAIEAFYPADEVTRDHLLGRRTHP